MAIQNEVFKFVAEMELDEKTTQEFTEALKMANDSCDKLRQTIAKNQKELMKMSAAGKENTEEFKALKKELAENTTNLKKSSEQANKYASALGVNKMTANQLKGYIKRLKTEMDSLHKDVDPELWNKYNDKLKAAQSRMKELEGGIKETGGVMDLLQSKWGKMAGWATVAKKVLSAIYGGLERISHETQVFGDKWQMAHAQISAGWSQLLANISSGSGVMKSSIKEAMQAAKEAKELTDELFERNNSLRIYEANSKKDIAEQQAIVNDATKSAEERLAAMAKISEIEGKIASFKQSIAQQENDIAAGVLKNKTQLDDDQLKLFVNAYNENRDAFKLAEEYNRLLEAEAEANTTIERATGQSNNAYLSRSYNEAKIVLKDIEEKKAEYSETIVEFARIISQYQLSNDEEVLAYVDAQVRLAEANAIVAEADAARKEKESSLKKQMTAEQTQATEDAYNARIKAAEDAYGLELIKLKEQLGKKEISEAEYQAKSYSAEMVMLVQKRAINEAYGKDVISIDQTIADKRLEIQKTVNTWMASNSKDTATMMTSFASGQADTISKEIDSMMQALQQEIENDPDLASNPVLDALAYKNSTSNVGKDARLADLQSSFDAEMASLENLHEYKLISEEEYLARKKALTEDYAAQERAIQTEGWTGALESAMAVLDGISQAMSAAQEAEYANLDAWKAKELAAAGENAEKREQIEAEYEAKKLDLQKKYADADIGIQIAQSIAAGAMAMIQAWNAAGGNPVLAGVIMGLIGATTTAQVATIIAQRNAIKSTTAGGSGDSSSGGTTTVRTVNGYSEGGYTGCM